ncbi:MAG: 3-oxoacyl-[acyl-carrier-protein] synthase III C-terminal domain-containing protein [Verrucomicrobiota bacterium]
MNCYITATSSCLPGRPVSNEEIPDYLGELDGEEAIRTKILRMNGIRSRHYALDAEQSPTHDLYELATLAASDCLKDQTHGNPITYLSAGSTNAPLTGPGLSSRIHDHMQQGGHLSHPVEINSNSGICTASAQALVNSVRAIRSGEHNAALAIGVEQPSEILKSSAINPPDDRADHDDIKRSKWFMSVFLRTMLSDGAGAMQLCATPNESRLSFKVNWTFSRSFAHETPLCMQLNGKTNLLSQDVDILAQHMKPCAHQTLAEGLSKYKDDLGSYQYVLPHISSFFFKRYLLSELRAFADGAPISYWTNLETVGNTGAASIYIMLDQFSKTQQIRNGDKIMLFIPESGQFNFVLVSLTAHTA